MALQITTFLFILEVICHFIFFVYDEAKEPTYDSEIMQVNGQAAITHEKWKTYATVLIGENAKQHRAHDKDVSHTHKKEDGHGSRMQRGTTQINDLEIIEINENGHIHEDADSRLKTVNLDSSGDSTAVERINADNANMAVSSPRQEPKDQPAFGNRANLAGPEASTVPPTSVGEKPVAKVLDISPPPWVTEHCLKTNEEIKDTPNWLVLRNLTDENGNDVSSGSEHNAAHGYAVESIVYQDIHSALSPHHAKIGVLAPCIPSSTYEGGRRLRRRSISSRYPDHLPYPRPSPFLDAVVVKYADEIGAHFIPPQPDDILDLAQYYASSEIDDTFMDVDTCMSTFLNVIYPKSQRARGPHGYYRASEQSMSIPPFLFPFASLLEAPLSKASTLDQGFSPATTHHISHIPDVHHYLPRPHSVSKLFLDNKPVKRGYPYNPLAQYLPRTRLPRGAVEVSDRHTTRQNNAKNLKRSLRTGCLIASSPEVLSPYSRQTLLDEINASYRFSKRFLKPAEIVELTDHVAALSAPQLLLSDQRTARSCWKCPIGEANGTCFPPEYGLYQASLIVA